MNLFKNNYTISIKSTSEIQMPNGQMIQDLTILRPIQSLINSPRSPRTHQPQINVVIKNIEVCTYDQDKFLIQQSKQKMDCRQIIQPTIEQGIRESNNKLIMSHFSMEDLQTKIFDQITHQIVPISVERKKVKLIHFINQTNSLSGSFFNTTIRDKILPDKKQEVKTKQRSYLQSLTKLPVRQIEEQIDDYEYILRYSTRTLKGVMSSKPLKVNQDSYLIYPHIGRKAFSHFFTVCDGHGSNGHLVSSLIKQGFPLFINTRRDELEANAPLALSGIFESLHQKLLKHETIDSRYSGTTIVCIYMIHDQLFCANLGDSRAILGQQIDGKWRNKALSRDHKPTELDEAFRIQSQGGRIESYVDPNGRHMGPKRVWLRSENIPGLAMTRSMGDQLAESVGVTHEPEILCHKLTLSDQIIVMGSDGLFEYLSNEQIIEIVAKYYFNSEIEAASDELLLRAKKSWQMNSSMIDDITFIVFFMNY